MTSVDASEAREKLYGLLEETVSDHKPVLITGPHSNAVLVGEEDWNSIQETLYLLSVPGMRQSLQGWPRRLIDVRKNRAGDALADRLHKAGAVGRPSSGFGRSLSEAKQPLSMLAVDLFRRPQPFWKLLGDLRGAYSRRINIQHRLVYQVV